MRDICSHKLYFLICIDEMNDNQSESIKISIDQFTVRLQERRPNSNQD